MWPKRFPKRVLMRTRVSMRAVSVGGLKGFMSAFGMMAAMFGGGASVAQAQLSNSPLHQPPPTVTLPIWQTWQGVQDGGAPLYIPAPRYPLDSRNPTLDNRAPTLRSATPDLYDSTQRQSSPPDDGVQGMGVRRSEGLRAPGVDEPGRLLRR